MRIGFITDANVERLDWAARHGFRSIQWNRFDRSFAAPQQDIWRPYAERFAGEAAARAIRISAIGALYANPLDPAQREHARAIFQRAIDVAAHLGIKTVSGFPGAVIELETHPVGNNPIYKNFGNFLPRLLEFWEPLASYAANKNVRLAFEHCPKGAYNLPVMGFNMLGQPAMWERLFNETQCENIGIEWDAAHLVCQFIDPVQNIRKFGSRIFHVHAKDALIDQGLLQSYGICHPGVSEHRFPGFGQSDWGAIIHELLRAGYDSDLTIEGWHDPVFRDHPLATASEKTPLAGKKLEEAGLLAAKKTLEQFTPQD